MDAVVRGAVVYLVLLVLVRITGKRSLAQITTFDFVLLLIVAEAVQQALIDTDNSITNAFLLITTLIGLDVLLSLLKNRSAVLERVLDGRPVVVIERGVVHRDRMGKERVDEDDVLEAGRQTRNLRRLDEVDYAVVERSGKISIVSNSGEG